MNTIERDIEKFDELPDQELLTQGAEVLSNYASFLENTAMDTEDVEEYFRNNLCTLAAMVSGYLYALPEDNINLKLTDGYRLKVFLVKDDA